METVPQGILDVFYNLKKKIIELSVGDPITKSLIESLAILEHQLLKIQDKKAPSLEEIDMTLSINRQTSIGNDTVAGPSKAMQNFIKNEQMISARRIDWIISYGKLCDARCNLAEAEAEEKTAQERLNRIIS
jgi:hypothetical protein